MILRSSWGHKCSQYLRQAVHTPSNSELAVAECLAVHYQEPP